MRYLITTNDSGPFLTNWFDPENNFNAEVGMIVYDLYAFKFTKDGQNWNKITEDNL